MIEKYLIWNGKYSGDSLIFWREGKSGYTCDIDQAHKFDFEEAKQIQLETQGTHKTIPLSHLEKISRRQIHNDLVNRGLFGKEASNV